MEEEKLSTTTIQEFTTKKKKNLPSPPTWPDLNIDYETMTAWFKVKSKKLRNRALE